MREDHDADGEQMQIICDGANGRFEVISSIAVSLPMETADSKSQELG